MADQAATSDFIDTFVNDVSTAVGTDPATGGIPTGIIQAIIALIMSFLGGCPIPPVPAHVNGTSNLKTVRMMQAIRENGIRPLSAQGQKLLAAMQASSAKVSDADAKTFIAMSQGQ